MHDQTIQLIIFATLKLTFTLAGTFIIYLGYNLFLKGLFTESGEINASFGDKSIAVKKAAPGTFFALFGAVIIFINVFNAHYGSTYQQSTANPGLSKQDSTLLMQMDTTSLFKSSSTSN
jgi:hypothetical protein